MLLLCSTVAALVVGVSLAACPGEFKIAGSSTVYPIAVRWTQGYGAQADCTVRASDDPIGLVTGAQILVGGGGSGQGASGVCSGTIDIGNMSREWRATEATSPDAWNYRCNASGRTVTRVDVGIDGVTVVVKKVGVGATCLGFLKGLTPDQLRFMYSPLTIAQLQQTGWLRTSLSAGTGATSPLWSSLHKSCADKEFNLSGPDQANSGTSDFFKEKIFKASSGESLFDNTGIKGYKGFTSDGDTLAYVRADDAAIGFFGYAYYFSNAATLTAAKIRNRFGVFVLPTKATILSNEYNPLTRRIAMNTLKTSLAITRPFLEYGYSPAGDADVVATGYDPIPAADQILMLSRIGSTKGVDIQGIVCGNNGVLRVGVGAPAQSARINIWSLLYTAKCPKVDMAVVNIPTLPNINAPARTCTTGTTALEAGITSVAVSKTLYKPTTVQKPYIVKCPTSAKKLVEVTISPSTFAYINDASAVFGISRGFFRFCLSSIGANLLAKIGLVPNNQAVTTAQLKKIPAPGSADCFSADSTVEVMDRGVIAMKDLAIGDVVKVAGGKFSEVYSFGHYDQDVKTTFLSIDAGLEKPLLLTYYHMVFVEGEAVPAFLVSVGDKLSLVDGLASVKAIKVVTKAGAFAPFTKEGTIVVDSVVASSYVNIKGETSLNVGGVLAFDLHYLAHIAQAPHRLVCEISSAFCAAETYNNGISAWIEAPHAFSVWLLKQHPVVMTAIFVPAFAFIFFVAAIESVVSTPVLLLILVATSLFMACKVNKSA